MFDVDLYSGDAHTDPGIPEIFCQIVPIKKTRINLDIWIIVLYINTTARKVISTNQMETMNRRPNSDSIDGSESPDITQNSYQHDVGDIYMGTYVEEDALEVFRPAWMKQRELKFTANMNGEGLYQPVWRRRQQFTFIYHSGRYHTREENWDIFDVVDGKPSFCVQINPENVTCCQDFPSKLTGKNSYLKKG